MLTLDLLLKENEIMPVIRFQTIDSVRKDGEHIDEDAGSNKSKVMIISWPSNKTFDL